MKQGVIGFALLAVLILSGCAGKHTLPDRDYALNNGDDSHYAIAFDQDGYLYPLSTGCDTQGTECFDWNSTEYYDFSAWCSQAFQLRSVSREDGSSPYSEETDKAVRETLAAQLNQALEGKDTLFVFIHGFNNSYQDAKTNIDKMREKVQRGNAVSLSVFWDGLKETGINNMLPFRWSKALVYSNLAGQLGLRRLLNRLEKPVKLVFVTHSRGAAVAFSTLFDPKYDNSIDAPGGKKSKADFEAYEPLKTQHISAVDMLLFAPAIGGGHVIEEQLLAHDTFKTRVFSAANRSDFATCKIINKSGSRGSSELGCKEEYINQVEAMLANNDHIEFTPYIFGKKKWWSFDPESHSIGLYLEQAPGVLCDSGYANFDCKD